MAIERITPKVQAWKVQGHLRLEDGNQVAVCAVEATVPGDRPADAIQAFQEVILDSVNQPLRRPKGMRKATSKDLMATVVRPAPDVAQRAAEAVAEALARACYDSRNPTRS